MIELDASEASPLTNGPTLWFEKLRVEQYLGIGHPGFSVDEIAPGVNIVFGPNGIGKSTFAAAMHALLWPESKPRLTDRVSATVRCAAEKFDLDLIAGSVVPTPPGSDAPLRSLPPKDSADRYCLAFQDLIQSIDKPLAAELQREIAGGYDLAGACRLLGYQPGLKSTPTEKKRLEAASRRLKETRDKESVLTRDENSLHAQHRKYDDARRAAVEADLYRHVESYFEARADAIEAARALSALGRRAGRAVGTEVEDADSYDRQEQQAKAELLNATLRLRAGRMALRACGLARLMVSDAEISELNERASAIRQAEVDLSAIEAAASRDTEAERQARRRIATGGLDRERADRLDGAALTTIRDLMREADQLAGQREALDAIRELWDVPTVAGDGDKLASAVQILETWLSAASAPVSSEAPGLTPVVIAAIAAVIACIALAVRDIVWLVLLIPVGGAVWLAVKQAIAGARALATDERASLESQYDRLAASKPDSWSDADVRRRLGELRSALRKDELDRDKSARWREFSGRLATYQTKSADFERRRAAVLSPLGLDSSLTEPPSSVLSIRCEELVVWRRADVALRQTQAHVETCVRAHTERVDSFNAMLAKFGWSAVADGHGALAAAAALQAAEHKRRAAAIECAVARSDAQRHVKSIRDARSGRRLLYARAGIALGDRNGLQAFIAQRQDYETRRRRLDEARGVARQLLPDLAKRVATDGSTAPQSRCRRFIRAAAPDLLTLPLEEVRRRKQAAEVKAALANVLRDEIVRTEERIATARREHVLEDAIAEEQAARDGLADARERALRLTAGHALWQYVAADTRSHDRPAVFIRAAQLLTEFTAGQWELDFDDGEPAQFRATESKTGATRLLDELSSGTRIQVLMAVRLGYIEAQERGIKLPIIVDEALANSDDARAEAITAALLGCVARGRQLFYLTAQRDEVEKWTGHGLTPGNTPHLIDLARIRGRAEAEWAPRPARTALVTAKSIPPPRDRADRHSYAEHLDAPGYSPRDGDGSIDLCWIADSPHSVHAFRTRGMMKWGQLRGRADVFVNAGIVSHDEALRMEARARLLSALAAHWKIGRPAKLDFGTVLASGAVSSVHADRIRNLLSATAGDGGELIRRLERGEVPGFQRKKLAELREFLLENDRISDERPLSPEEMHDRLHASAAEYVATGILNEQDLAELLSLMPEG